ncbi:MAG: DUF3575 domain-containing protein, partial [Duncaniella sp.]|nr:DUF3575 domain-containing protein [Duncaniella sp.]
MTVGPSVLTAAETGRGISVKTDLLYWLTATPNLALEWPVAPRVSVSATFGYNAFNFLNRYDSEGQPLNPKLHHWLLMPGGRYWLRAVADGGYVGAHLLGGQYNAGGVRFPRFLRHHRYEGWGVGAGISYGYRWQFSPAWGMEASVGASYLYLRYHKYDCGSCGGLVASRHRHAVIPTVSLSVVYRFPTNSTISQIR